MHRNTLAFVIAALVAGFVAGFWLANSINRSALTNVTPQSNSNTAAQTSNAPGNSATDLSIDEIKAKVAEADRNPTNFKYQRDLGIALYRYSAMRSDATLLPEAIRLLERARSIEAKDFDVLVALGNAHFDTGFVNKDNESYRAARDIYAKALEIKPADADVQTDLAITYLLQNPPDNAKAASGLQKVFDADPRHERSLQFLVQALAKQGKSAEAQSALDKLRTLDPDNSAIPELTTLVATGK